MNSRKIKFIIEKTASHLKNINKFFSFLCKFNGPVIVCSLPANKKEETGYFYRIRAIDDIFYSVPAVYVNWNRDVARQPYFDAHPRRMQLNLQKKAVYLPLILLVLKGRKIYFHHVASIRPFFRFLARLPFITTFIDFHGAAPEEHEMAGLHEKVEEMANLEAFALTRLSFGIVVTEAMKSHLLKKYGEHLCRLKFIALPIIQNIKIQPREWRLPDEKYVVVYAGNMQKWQQIPLMFASIEKRISTCEYRLCCTDADMMNKMFAERVGLKAYSLNHADLLEVYKDCHLGFILREDCIVNRVACPTKLVEYMAHGVIPIILSAEIGDFKESGMNYITIEQFIEGYLPNKNDLKKMAEANYAVFQRLYSVYIAGKNEITGIILEQKE